MRTRMRFLFLLPLVCSLVGRPVSAATNMVLQAVGSVQGNIPGESTVPGHAAWIDILSYSLGVDAPTGSDGLPTGPTRPSPLNLMKTFDRATLKLLAVASTQEAFTSFTMEFRE